MVRKSNSCSYPVNSMWRQTNWLRQHSTNMGVLNLSSLSIPPPGPNCPLMDARLQYNLPRPYITNNISLHYVSTIDCASIGQVTSLRILNGHSIPLHTADSRDKERSSASWDGKNYRLRVGYIKGLHATTTGVPHVQQTMKTTIMCINVSTLLARNGAHHYWTRYLTSFTLFWIQILWQLFVSVFERILMTVPLITWSAFLKVTLPHHTTMSLYSRTLLDGTILYMVKYLGNGI
jgi:hypothetical protein